MNQQKKIKYLLSKRKVILDDIESNIRKKFNDELKDFDFKTNQELFNVKLGGILKYVTNDLLNIYGGILVNVSQIKDSEALLITLKGRNGFYNIKSNNYFLYYSTNNHKSIMRKFLESLLKNNKNNND